MGRAGESAREDGPSQFGEEDDPSPPQGDEDPSPPQGDEDPSPPGEEDGPPPPGEEDGPSPPGGGPSLLSLKRDTSSGYKRLIGYTSIELPRLTRTHRVIPSEPGSNSTTQPSGQLGLVVVSE